MSEASAESEKQYSVVAEMEDGRTETLSVRGRNPGAAFQQVKAMPGVRRVGRVTDASQPAGRPAPRREAAPPGHAPRPREAAAPHGTPGEAAPGSARGLGNTITGPRVVVHTRAAGGEQPFKHLQPPPERPDPPPPPKRPEPAPQPTAAKQAPPAPEQPAPPAEAADATADSPAPPRDYRILKSRRRDGLPYVLQRGHWEQLKGKRTFVVEWEKAFANRAEAEERQRWLAQTAREMADADLHHVA